MGFILLGWPIGTLMKKIAAPGKEKKALFWRKKDEA